MLVSYNNNNHKNNIFVAVVSATPIRTAKNSYNKNCTYLLGKTYDVNYYVSIYSAISIPHLFGFDVQVFILFSNAVRLSFFSNIRFRPK
jgi:hypothetical protein